MAQASVRGANGINLFVTPVEPADPMDLMSCTNIDLSVERAILPRRGLGRPESWSGLIYTANGSLFANEFGASVLDGSISSMCASGGLFRTSPVVTA